MNRLDLARRVLAAAKRAGADQADLRLEAGRELTVQVRMGELEVLKQAERGALSLRVFVDRRKAVVSSTELEPELCEAMAAEAVALARHCEPDDQHRLPEPERYATRFPELDLHDAEPGPDAAAGIVLAREAEAAALDADARIDNSQGAGYASGDHELVYVTSNGFEHSRRGSSHSLSMMPVATDSRGERVTEGWARRARHFAELVAPAELGAEAARRVLRRLDARMAPTGRFPVIFEPRMAARMAGMLFGCLSGDAVRRERSYLAGRLGTRVGSELLTLIDDPLRSRGLGSRACDGEGLASERLELVAAGVLAHHATDVESARRLELPATGHGRWGGGVVASNLHFAAGSVPALEILGGVEAGLLVTGMMGGGFQAASGHWSQGCLGLWIEKGQVAYPVREVTVAGSFDEVLGAVDAVGDDLDFTLGAVTSPTLRVSEMAVAGGEAGVS